MATERVFPILPCRDLRDVVPFYGALGFELTYRQERPNPYAAFRRGGIDLHFFAVPEFDPATSMGSAGLVVHDTGALHTAFAAGLRAAFGKVPISGIPRMTRPRRRQGIPAGFTVVDPGGNWLRISRLGDADDGSADPPADAGGRLGRVVATAARQADSHGDESAAIRILETGLVRHADAPPVQRLPALVFLAELRLRTGARDSAVALLAEIGEMQLSAADQVAVAADLAIAADLTAELRQ